MKACIVIRLVGLLAFLGFSLSLLGIPMLLDSSYLHDFGPLDYRGGMQKGLLIAARSTIMLTLAFYGGLFLFCTVAVFRDRMHIKLIWLNALTLSVFTYLSFYAILVHTEWAFQRILPEYLQGAFETFFTPADRIGRFLIEPASAIDDFILKR